MKPFNKLLGLGETEQPGQRGLPVTISASGKWTAGEPPDQNILVAVANYATGANRAPSWGAELWFLNGCCGVPKHNHKQEESYTMVRQGLPEMRRCFNESAFILINGL